MKHLVLGLVLSLAACGSGGPSAQEPSAGGKAHKGGGQKGEAAKEAGQHVGRVLAERDHGEQRGVSYESVGCDEADEGISWCDSDTEIAFCAGGQWWLLDCSHPDIDGDFCGDAGTTVDCYAVSEL